MTTRPARLAESEDCTDIVEEALAHCVYQTSHGLRVELRVRGSLVLDGQRYTWNRVLTLPLHKQHETPD